MDDDPVYPYAIVRARSKEECILKLSKNKFIYKYPPYEEEFIQTYNVIKKQPKFEEKNIIQILDSMIDHYQQRSFYQFYKLDDYVIE